MKAGRSVPRTVGGLALFAVAAGGCSLRDARPEWLAEARQLEWRGDEAGAFALLDAHGAAESSNREVLGAYLDSAVAMDCREEADAASMRLAWVAPADPEALRMRAWMVWNAGRAEEALCIARAALELDPDSAPLLSLTGSIQVELGETESGLAFADAACVLDPESARAHRCRGSALFELGRDEEALAEADLAVERDPRHWPGHSLAARAARKLGRSEREREALRGMVNCGMATAEVLVSLGQVCRKLGDVDGARVAFNHAARIDPREQEAWFGLGMCDHDLGWPAEAAADMQRALDINPEGVNAWYWLATARHDLHQDVEAVRAFEEAIRIDPECWYALNDLGQIWFERGEYDKAEEHFRRATAAAPLRATCRWNLAAVERALGRVSALEHFERARDLGYKGESLRGSLAYAYLQAERLDEAAKLVEDGTEEEQRDVYFRLSRLVLARAGRGDKEQARADAGKLVEEFKGVALVHIEVGLLAMSDEQWQDALNQFTPLIRMGMAKGKAVVWAAACHGKLGRVNEGLEVLERGMVQLGEDAEAWALLCQLTREAELWERSLDAGKKSCELAPERWLSRYQYAKTMSEVGKHGSSGEEYLKAYELHPVLPGLAIMAAEEFESAGQWGMAASTYHTVTEAHPEDADLVGCYAREADAWRRVKQRERAVAAYRLALAKLPTGAYERLGVGLKLGRVLSELQRGAEAITAYREAIAARPAASSPREALCRELFRAGDLAGLKTELAALRTLDAGAAERLEAEFPSPAARTFTNLMKAFTQRRPAADRVAE